MGMGTLRRYYASATEAHRAAPAGRPAGGGEQAPLVGEQPPPTAETDLNALQAKNAPKVGPGITKAPKTPSKPL